jgi:hypothetical protein
MKADICTAAVRTYTFAAEDNDKIDYLRDKFLMCESMYTKFCSSPKVWLKIIFQWLISHRMTLYYNKGTAALPTAPLPFVVLPLPCQEVLPPTAAAELNIQDCSIST